MNSFRIELAFEAEFYIYVQDHKLLNMNVNAKHALPFSLYYLNTKDNPGVEEKYCY